MARDDEKDGREELPRTLKRSDKHAQEIWVKTHDSAVETYGEGRRAHMVAFASLKHSYKKQGDRWVPKQEKGPSDPQAAQGRGDPPKPTARGKVAGSEKEAREKAKEAEREYDRDRREKIAKGQW